MAADGQYTSHLAIAAVDNLLAHHPDVRWTRSTTSSSRRRRPTTRIRACRRYSKITTGCRKPSARSTSAPHALGSPTGSTWRAGLIGTRQVKRVLVIVADTLTRSVDYTDRSTAVLFGDGGGAALIEYSAEPAIFGMDAGADGNGGKFLYRTGLRTEINGIEDASRLLRQEGSAVYRWVVENIPPAIARVLDRAGLGLEDIDWFVPHSANLRMIEALDKRLPFPIERTLFSIVEYGNTSAVSIPLALVPAVRDGRVRPGQKLLLMGFGGGLVTAGNVVLWT